MTKLKFFQRANEISLQILFYKKMGRIQVLHENWAVSCFTKMGRFHVLRENGAISIFTRKWDGFTIYTKMGRKWGDFTFTYDTPGEKVSKVLRSDT